MIRYTVVTGWRPPADRVAGLSGLTVQAHCLSGYSHYPPPQPPAQLERCRVEGVLKPYLPVASELTFQDGLLVRGNQIVIPTSLRVDILERLYSSHQGISKCRERDRQSVWWPGLGRQLEEVTRSCVVCSKHRVQAPEPLIPSIFSTLPWQ